MNQTGMEKEVQEVQKNDQKNKPAGYCAHNQNGLLLNANENNYPLEKEVFDDLMEACSNVLFNRYPEDSAKELREAYSHYIGLKPDQIIVGNGSDQMLQLLIGAFGGPDKTLLTLDPDFGMYDFYASSFYCPIEKFSFDLKNGFDAGAFIKKAKEAAPSLVLFSNPNNPSGFMLSSNQVKKMADALYPIPVIADEAYMEFGADSALKYIEDTPNLYITRTLSKAFGMAGLRIGFLLSSAKNIEALLPYKIVYNVSSLSAAAAKAVLGHAGLYQKQVDEIICERNRLKKDFEALNLECGPANANYLCVFPEKKEAFVKAFEENGIQIRNYPEKPYVRITIGTPQQNAQVLKIVQKLQA